MRVPLTRTQRKFLLLLQRGYHLEVEKRAHGYVSSSCGAEIGGRGIRFDAARKMIAECLVEKVGEDDRTVRYAISSMAVRLLDSMAEARR